MSDNGEDEGDKVITSYECTECGGDGRIKLDGFESDCSVCGGTGINPQLNYCGAHCLSYLAGDMGPCLSCNHMGLIPVED